ncbi:MAG: hypothetical protein ABR964_03240 [Tepidisphaeraceae bacterium]|jgi:hypothetical protein
MNRATLERTIPATLPNRSNPASQYEDGFDSGNFTLMAELAWDVDEGDIDEAMKKWAMKNGHATFLLFPWSAVRPQG